MDHIFNMLGDLVVGGGSWGGEDGGRRMMTSWAWRSQPRSPEKDRAHATYADWFVKRETSRT